MTLNITISPEAEAKLREKAAVRGESLDSFAARLLERAATSPTVDEVLAPFCRQVAESSMSDEELDRFFSDVRDKAYQERQQRRRAGAPPRPASPTSA